ncbi:MAG: hypothetical protein V6Z89_03915 [Desulfobacter sp.]
MDFDTLITYILLFLFFVLPSILKRKGQKKKTAPREKKKKPSIFDRLGQKIQEFIRELEKQAREAKKEQDGSVWDELDDRDEEMVPAYEAGDGDFQSHEPEAPDLSRPGTRTVRVTPPEQSHPKDMAPTCPAVPAVRAGLPAHALQQAVVWSEVLGPPIALRKD